MTLTRQEKIEAILNKVNGMKLYRLRTILDTELYKREQEEIDFTHSLIADNDKDT